MNDKTGLHPKNLHKSSYDFKSLIKAHPALGTFVKMNKFNNESVDFSDASAVKALNTALLKYFYNISFWDIPKDYLCPPIPGRADYIHHVADLFNDKTNLRMLDIGVGANCIYPLIANKAYGWSVVGSDIEKTSLENAEKIVIENSLEKVIEIREQKDKNKFFSGIILKDEYFHLTICNPPFHASAAEA
ncbi:MAG: RlmF-related methyltransferase, partial [Bdellovibrionales bacterium]|nr:RlmF-related methyltransferase [Bdellovibrionales bacterium]